MILYDNMGNKYVAKHKPGYNGPRIAWCKPRKWGKSEREIDGKPVTFYSTITSNSRNYYFHWDESWYFIDKGLVSDVNCFYTKILESEEGNRSCIKEGKLEEVCGPTGENIINNSSYKLVQEFLDKNYQYRRDEDVFLINFEGENVTAEVGMGISDEGDYILCRSYFAEVPFETRIPMAEFLVSANNKIESGYFNVKYPDYDVSFESEVFFPGEEINISIMQKLINDHIQTVDRFIVGVRKIHKGSSVNDALSVVQDIEMQDLLNENKAIFDKVLNLLTEWEWSYEIENVNFKNKIRYEVGHESKSWLINAFIDENAVSLSSDLEISVRPEQKDELIEFILRANNDVSSVFGHFNFDISNGLISYKSLYRIYDGLHMEWVLEVLTHALVESMSKLYKGLLSIVPADQIAGFAIKKEDEDEEEDPFYYDCPFCRRRIPNGEGCEHALFAYECTNCSLMWMDKKLFKVLVEVIKHNPDYFLEDGLDRVPEELINDAIGGYCTNKKTEIYSTNKNELVRDILLKQPDKILTYDILSNAVDAQFIEAYEKGIKSIIPSFSTDFGGEMVPHSGWFGVYYGLVSDEDINMLEEKYADRRMSKCYILFDYAWHLPGACTSQYFFESFGSLQKAGEHLVSRLSHDLDEGAFERLLMDDEVNEVRAAIVQLKQDFVDHKIKNTKVELDLSCFEFKIRAICIWPNGSNKILKEVVDILKVYAEDYDDDPEESICDDDYLYYKKAQALLRTKAAELDQKKFDEVFEYMNNNHSCAGVF